VLYLRQFLAVRRGCVLVGVGIGERSVRSICADVVASCTGILPSYFSLSKR